MQFRGTKLNQSPPPHATTATREEHVSAEGVPSDTIHAGEETETDTWEDDRSDHSPASKPAKRRSKRRFDSLPASPRRALSMGPHLKSSSTKSKASTSLSAGRTPPPRAAQEGFKFRKEEIMLGVINGAVFSARYLLDVFHTAICYLRFPISMLVFFWLLAFILGRMTHTIRAIFSPLCYVPGISNSHFCKSGGPPSSPSTPSGRRPLWADFPKLVDVQSRSFAQLMDGVLADTSLSLEIKKAEMATSDLAILVRASKLTSRDLLADSLRGFVQDAKTTSRALQRLNSKIEGAVDNIMAVNDYALHAIETAKKNTPSLFSLQILSPWATNRPVGEVVTETFSEAMSILSSNMQRLILEAEANLANLNNLEERLSTLHDIAAREDSHLTAEKSDLLAQLWTQLGGNKRVLHGVDSNLMLLRELGMYRKQARAHVVAALETLQSMSEDMEDLRERVASPELVGMKIPVEVHMKSIKNGIERLREGRNRARRIEEDKMRRFIGAGDYNTPTR